MDKIIQNADLVRNLGRDVLHNCIFNMFRMMMLCTKHPGFAEEREWRIIYSPTLAASDVILKDYAVVRGVPQEIYKIPLKHDPENGLFGADIPSLLNRLIIGPSQQPLTIFQALTSVLVAKQVENVFEKVTVSDIPLRHG